MGCNRSYRKDWAVLFCRDWARNANALGTFPAAQETEGFAGASGGRDSAQAELQQRPQPCTTALLLPASTPGTLRSEASASGLAVALAMQQGREEVGASQGKPQRTEERRRPHGEWISISD